MIDKAVGTSDRNCPHCNRPILVINGKLAPICAGCGADVHQLWLASHQMIVKVCPKGCITGELPDWVQFCPLCKAPVKEEKKLTEPDPWTYDYGKTPPVFRNELAGEEE